MTFALVRQEKADDARASRAATPPHARTPDRPRSLLSHPDRWHVAEASRSVARTIGGARSVGRSLDRALVPLGDDGRRAIVVRDTEIRVNFLCPRFPIEGS